MRIFILTFLTLSILLSGMNKSIGQDIPNPNLKINEIGETQRLKFDTLSNVELFKEGLIAHYKIDDSKIDYLSVSTTHIENLDINASEIKAFSFRLGKYDGIGLNNLVAQKGDLLYSNSKIIKIDSSDIKVLTFLKDTITNFLSINELNGISLKITESVVNVLKLRDINVMNIVLDNSVIKKNSQISGRIGGTIFLKDMEFENNAILDLRFLRSKIDGQRIALDLTSCPIDRILIDYRNFKLAFKLSDGDLINSVYETLLDNFKKNGQSESFKLLDIEYKSFKNKRKVPIIGAVWDQCNVLWWNYGYSRERVFFCTIFILIFFSIINVFLYRRLNNEIYNIENFSPLSSGKLSFFMSFKYSLTYTAIIFFKFNVSAEKLKLTNTILLMWFALIYLSGLFCTFFIINAILKI
jgi:hypothetical protein